MEYMKRAIELAKKGRGTTKTNPLVGAVIVKNGRIIGEGYHKFYGGDHAEVIAVKSATEPLEGSTIYVTLEPCSHYGKTPPCANLLVEKKFSKVVIGSTDPNPKVNGGGIKILKDAGIEVVVGVMEEECRELNKEFFYSLKTGLPYVVLKSATTLDGKIASYTGDSKWISNELSRTYAHRLRSEMDGILVGIGTILKDDPSLNVRLVDSNNDPARIILDSNLRIPLSAKVLHLKSNAPTIIATLAEENSLKFRELESLGAIVLRTKSKGNKIDLRDLLQKLYTLKIGNILLEGGMTVNYSMLKENLVNKVIYFIAPKLLGGVNSTTSIGGEGIESVDNGIKLKNVKYSSFGEDICIEGEICLRE